MRRQQHALGYPTNDGGFAVVSRHRRPELAAAALRRWVDAGHELILFQLCRFRSVNGRWSAWRVVGF